MVRPTRTAPGLGGAELFAVYLPDGSGGGLRAACTAGGPGERYGLEPACPRDGGSPVAEAFRTGRPSRPAAGEGVALGALPLRADGAPLGCLAVAGPEEFGGDRRGVLELTARHVADLLRAGGARGACGPRARGADPVAARWARGGGRPGAGAVRARAGGVRRARGNAAGAPGARGRARAALAAGPAPAACGDGEREREFRVGRPAAEPRWLHLRCHRAAPPEAPAASDGHFPGGAPDAQVPQRLLGVPADADAPRPRADGRVRGGRLRRGGGARGVPGPAAGVADLPRRRRRAGLRAAAHGPSPR